MHRIKSSKSENLVSIFLHIPLLFDLVLELFGADNIFPLGMESRLIPDAGITVSSMYGTNTRGGFGRLNKEGKPWCTKTADPNPYFQVDLGKPTRICAVATQGRGIGTSNLKYPEVFWVQMTNDSVKWTTLQHHEQIKVTHFNTCFFFAEVVQDNCR